MVVLFCDLCPIVVFEILPAITNATAYRETVVLHYFSGLAYEEIAFLTGVSEGTVKSRMSRAKAKLAQTLQKDGEKDA